MSKPLPQSSIWIQSAFGVIATLILTNSCNKNDSNVPVANSVIEASYHHSLALKEDGTLWAWGANRNGQVGDGTNVDKITPVLIGSGYVFISTGFGYSLALQTDGSLWAWGDNGSGRLGDGTSSGYKYVPVRIVL